MKKIIFLIVLSCIISSCKSFKETIKQEIIDELTESKEVEKGDGYHFYNEQIYLGEQGYYIHHSTLDCPAIIGGVQIDCRKIDPYHNLFCSHCMDNDLITTWNTRAFPDGYENKK